MSSFLFYGDFKKQIQDDNLQAIIGKDLTILESTQQAAIEECRSYLVQKYDVKKALQEILKYDPNATYNAGQTVYVDAEEYQASSTYTSGDWVTYSGVVYQATEDITEPEEWDSNKWVKIANQYAIYYAIVPADDFNYKKVYAKDDTVFYKDSVYTCQLPSNILDHQSLLNIGQAGVEPLQNVFPDDPKNGVQYWGVGEPYEVDSIPLSDTDYWKQGDNRDQKLLMVCIDIALFHLHTRISPRNIPELRTLRYSGKPEDRISVYNAPIKYPEYSALGWLQSCSRGELTPSMPINQPETGNRIRFGGNQKNVNSY